jgi:hypothetical protein
MVDHGSMQSLWNWCPQAMEIGGLLDALLLLMLAAPAASKRSRQIAHSSDGTTPPV